MSLGLPAHLAPSAVRRSFIDAQHAVAITLLCFAILTTLVFQSAQPDVNLWLPLVALLPMLGLLFVVDQVHPALWSMSYLLVGGLGVHLYALGILSQPLPVHLSDGFSFLAVKAALILVAGVVTSAVAGIALAVAGYVTAELAVGIAQAQLDLPLHFTVAPLLTLLATVTIIGIIGLSSSRQMLVLPRLQQAAREEHLAGLRSTIEVKAAALMHDTILNHLAAIADSVTDRLDSTLRQQIGRDVRSLLGEEWLTDTPSQGHPAEDGTDWRGSALYTAVHEARELGLNVRMTGDLTSVGRIEKQASVALGLSVKQCLVNVLKHAGTLDVEVTIFPSASHVAVMVVDSGRGFVEATAGTDRLGLRSSVRKRIELVGGTVEIWSTLGVGTSIMITVPAKPAPTASSPENAPGAS